MTMCSEIKIGDVVILEKIHSDDAWFDRRKELENWLYIVKSKPSDYKGSLTVELEPLLIRHPEIDHEDFVFLCVDLIRL